MTKIPSFLTTHNATALVGGAWMRRSALLAS